MHNGGGERKGLQSPDIFRIDPFTYQAVKSLIALVIRTKHFEFSRRMLR